MNKEFLEKEIQLCKSTYKIASDSNCSQSTVKYWLKKYGLKTKCKPFNKGYKKELLCKYCGETNASNFYNPKRKKCIFIFDNITQIYK